MPSLTHRLIVLGTAVALAGCSYTNGVIDWATGTAPSDTAASSPASNTSIPIAPSAAENNQQPTVSAVSNPPPATRLPNIPPVSGTTFVGQKAATLRAELTQFQGNLQRHQAELQAARQSAAGNAANYFGAVASINTRLQAGTTPGNPELVGQWNRSQGLLDQMSNDVAALNTISNAVAGDASFGNYLLNEVRSAYNLQGGVEADRDQLRQIENQTLASLTGVDQLLNSLGTEIARQSTYVASERSNLVTLALAIQNGQLYGPSLANRSFQTAPAPAAPSSGNATALRQQTAPRAAAPASAPPASTDRPLVVIRFDSPDVAYEQPLYTAISRALERKPSAVFNIMAVAPNAGSPAQVAVNTNASRQNAENVLRSLTNMGLPADRVSLSASMSPDISSNEVRVFVR